jgi:hypothetical protein
MNPKAERGPQLLRNELGWSSALVDARLKKLRKERLLVQRAIIVLTEISRARSSREVRAIHD